MTNGRRRPFRSVRPRRWTGVARCAWRVMVTGPS